MFRIRRCTGGGDVTRIEEFGWRGAVDAGLGRVVSSHGDYYHLVCNEAEGEILARRKKSAFRRGTRAVEAAQVLPITGDFVRFEYNRSGESMITEVLPRFSSYERKDPRARRPSQTLAVNFDTLFLMMSLNENFSLPRLERYLELARSVGEARVAVVLTKTDLCGNDERDGAISAAKELVSRFGEVGKSEVSLTAISSQTGDGLDSLAAYVAPRQTVAFIGSSGVGKSTLVNALAGEDWQAVQEIQEWSGKGRHTTTSRELIRLPGGALVMDTPGIREIGRLGEEDDVLVKGESSHRYRR